MATKLSQAIDQLLKAGAILTVGGYVGDLEAFRALAMLTGAAIRSEWIDEYGKREIREIFTAVVDGQMMEVSTRRTPTVRDWSDLASKRDALDPKVVRT